MVNDYIKYFVQTDITTRYFLINAIELYNLIHTWYLPSSMEGIMGNTMGLSLEWQSLGLSANQLG